MSVEYAERLYKDDDESEFVLGGGGCMSAVARIRILRGRLSPSLRNKLRMADLGSCLYDDSLSQLRKTLVGGRSLYAARYRIAVRLFVRS
jgi:hypothetical protein